MDSLTNSVNFLLFIVVYIPLNILFMLAVAFILSVINRLFHLNFPTWAVSVAAAVLVFAIMYAVLETMQGKNELAGNSTALYYSTTLIINILVVILMLTLSGITRLIFRNALSVPFAFGRPQIIAAVVYAAVTVFFGLIPLFNQGKAQLNDIANEKYKEKLQKIISSNNVKEFEKALDKNYELSQLQLDPHKTQTLFDYTIEQNKPLLTGALIKRNAVLLTYSFDWDINSAEMVETLISSGMPAANVVEKLTAKNRNTLARMVVEQYHPRFDSGGHYLVNFITNNIIENKDTAFLDYLIQNGLTNNVKQTSEAVFDFIEKDDFGTTKMLVEKGYGLDTSQHRMVEQAITHENIPMLDLLFTHSFRANNTPGDYSYVEYAIVRNCDKVIDYLLKQRPDIKTIHSTQNEGDTNALMLAEKYQRTEILEKLKNYAAAE